VLHRGALLVLMDGFDAESSLALIEDEAISVVPVAPAVLAYWMNVPDLADRLSAVRVVLSGSAPLAPELLAAFTDRTGVEVHQGYGLTEAAPVVTSTLCSSRTAPGSVGAALPGIELELRDEAGGVPHGEGRGSSPRRRPGRDLGARGEPVRRVLARRLRRPGRRRLVRHR
jgi:long-chain acyl-CoA synthetase